MHKISVPQHVTPPTGSRLARRGGGVAKGGGWPARSHVGGLTARGAGGGAHSQRNPKTAIGGRGGRARDPMRQRQTRGSESGSDKLGDNLRQRRARGQQVRASAPLGGHLDAREKRGGTGSSRARARVPLRGQLSREKRGGTGSSRYRWIVLGHTLCTCKSAPKGVEWVHRPWRRCQSGVVALHRGWYEEGNPRL